MCKMGSTYYLHPLGSFNWIAIPYLIRMPISPEELICCGWTWSCEHNRETFGIPARIPFMSLILTIIWSNMYQQSCNSSIIRLAGTNNSTPTRNLSLRWSQGKLEAYIAQDMVAWNLLSNTPGPRGSEQFTLMTTANTKVIQMFLQRIDDFTGYIGLSRFRKTEIQKAGSQHLGIVTCTWYISAGVSEIQGRMSLPSQYLQAVVEQSRLAANVTCNFNTNDYRKQQRQSGVGRL
jgi:hypothetical protein